MKPAFSYLSSYVVERPACTITCVTASVQQGSGPAPNEELGGLWVLSHTQPWQPQEVSKAQGKHFFIWNFPTVCSKLLFSSCLDRACGSLGGGIWRPGSSSPTLSRSWLERATGLITGWKGSSRESVNKVIWFSSGVLAPHLVAAATACEGRRCRTSLGSSWCFSHVINIIA